MPEDIRELRDKLVALTTVVRADGEVSAVGNGGAS
jgi:hypothetical protein